MIYNLSHGIYRHRRLGRCTIRDHSYCISMPYYHIRHVCGTRVMCHKRAPTLDIAALISIYENLPLVVVAGSIFHNNIQYPNYRRLVKTGVFPVRGKIRVVRIKYSTQVTFST